MNNRMVGIAFEMIAHAQNHLITSMSFKQLVEEFVHLYERLENKSFKRFP